MVDKPLWQIALEHAILTLKHNILVLQSVIDNDGEWVDPELIYPRYVVTTWYGLLVRDRPLISGTRIGFLKYNQIVEIKTIEGTWASHDYNGVTGWSSINYLRKIG